MAFSGNDSSERRTAEVKKKGGQRLSSCVGQGEKPTPWNSLATLWQFVFRDFPLHRRFEAGFDYDAYWAEAGGGKG